MRISYEYEAPLLPLSMKHGQIQIKKSSPTLDKTNQHDYCCCCCTSMRIVSCAVTAVVQYLKYSCLWCFVMYCLKRAGLLWVQPRTPPIASRSSRHILYKTTAVPRASGFSYKIALRPADPRLNVELTGVIILPNSRVSWRLQTPTNCTYAWVKAVVALLVRIQTCGRFNIPAEIRGEARDERCAEKLKIEN